MALMQIEHGSTRYQQMVQLREEILRRPLGLSFTPEQLEAEKDDILIGAFDEGKILGCCILTEVAPDTVKLRQMAVSNKLQHMGIGYTIMQFAENLARDNRFEKIIMHARKDSIHFFEKLGYEVMSEPFIELTIPHVIMGKELSG